MSGRIEAKLAALGITLPTPAKPLAAYVPFVRAGNIVVISGQVPMQDGQMVFPGKVGEAYSIEQGQQAARLCLINVLAQLRAACAEAGGDLDQVRRVVRLGGFIASPPSFTQHHLVMNGASELAAEIFGESGQHARSTIGVPALPFDAAVEVEGMFELA